MRISQRVTGSRDIAQGEIDTKPAHQFEGLDGTAGFILGAGEEFQRCLGRADADHCDGP